MKYKVGDRVRIKSLDWYNEHKDETDDIECSNNIWFYREMSKFCGKVMTISHVRIDHYTMVEDLVGYWTDEMIEGLVEEETKSEPKFKVGDILFYRGETSGYLKVEEIREENGEIRYYETSRNLYLIENDPDVFADKVCSVETEETKPNTIEEAKTYWDSIKDAWICPEGYIFKDENGNTINATKIVLEKKPDDKLKLESTKKVREYWSEYARIFIEIYDDDPNECVFTHLWVVDGQRQKGYGKRALIEAETIAKGLGCHTAYLKVETNSWMYNWYLRCGYNWYKNADEGYTWLTKNL